MHPRTPARLLDRLLRGPLGVLLGLLLGALLLGGPRRAAAQERTRRLGEAVDLWSEPNPGIRYLRRSIEHPRMRVHALLVDLRHEGVQVVATRHEERWRSASDFARQRGAVAAINGGFWGRMQRPLGIAVGGGEPWANAEPDPEFGYFAVLRSGRAVVRLLGDRQDEESLEGVEEAVSGRPILVDEGEVATEAIDAVSGANFRQPRTAVGVVRGGHKVILIVVDGRQSESRGLSLYELARVMVELGAERALNLDGGGSSTLYLESVGGLVSSPSGGRWVSALGLDPGRIEAAVRSRTNDGIAEIYERGREREVLNHLAVLAPPPPERVGVRGAGSALGDGLPTERATPSARRPPPEPSLWRLGPARELLIPGAYFLGALFAFLLSVAILRRLARALFALVRRGEARAQEASSSPRRSRGSST